MKSKLSRLIISGIEQSLRTRMFVILNVIILLSTIVIFNFGTVNKIIDINSNKNNELSLVIIDNTKQIADKLVIKLESDSLIVDDFNEKDLTKEQVLIRINYDEKYIIKSDVVSKEYLNVEVFDKIKTVLNEFKDKIILDKYDINNEYKELLKNDVNINRTILDVNKSNYDKYGNNVMIITLLVYMLLMFVTSAIASTIGTEKISRTTEYMLTSISEKAYLWYNVIQINLVIIIQLLLSGIYYIIANMINNILSISFLNINFNLTNISMVVIPPILIKFYVVAIILLILSFLIISIIQSVITSKITNIQDIGNSTMILMFTIIGIYILNDIILQPTSIVNIYVKVISFIPIVSVFMIPKLILMGQITNPEILISILVSVFTLIIVTIVGSRMFKKGLLGISSKLEDKKKNEDINVSNLRLSLFRIAISLLLYLVLSNSLNLVLEMFTLSYNINKILQCVIFILSLYIPYSYLKRFTPNCISIKPHLSYVWMGSVFLVIIQIFAMLFNKFINVDIDLIEIAKISIDTPMQIILFIAQFALLPAIFEELLFRKGIINVLKKFGNANAIIISSILFGLIHQNIAQGIFAVLTGLVLGYIVVKTKSVMPAIMLHFLNNFFEVATYILNYNGLTKLLYLVYVIYFIIVFVGIKFLIKNLIKFRHKLVLKEENKINIYKYIFKEYIFIIMILLYVLITFYISMIL
jgi:membrane protease YdiL (CAAX protease family)/ABC-type Na+ efflux pump permease subunit